MAHTEYGETTHIGYAWRKHRHFRFLDDPREIGLEISAALAEKLLEAVNAHPDASVEGSSIQELEKVLADMLEDI
jgi:hypothetical protein